MIRSRFAGLRWRLVVLVGLAILPLVAMTIAVGVRERANTLASARDNLQRITVLAAANEAKSLEGAMQILRDLSSVPAVFADETQCNMLMAAILSKNDDFVNFGRIDLDGAVGCSAVIPSAPVNLGDRLHFKRAVSQKRFIAGNYVFGRVVHKHTVNVTYPVIRDGNVVSVLFAAIDLAELDKFLEDIHLPEGSALWTVDEEGTVISRRPGPAEWIGKKLPDAGAKIAATATHPVVFDDSDGVRRLYASSKVGPFSLSNYTILIGVPETHILSQARRDQELTLFGLLATILLAGAAAWWAGDVLIVRRVRVLAMTARSIASGALSSRTNVDYGTEEIGELAKALDDMAGALEAKDAARDDAQSQLVAADRRKDEFLATLAHELRNPLAPIRSGAEILKLTQQDRPMVARTAAIIARQVDQMSRLVDDLLDVSRVTRGLVQLDLKEFDLRLAIEIAAEQISPLMAQKHHQFVIDMPDVECIVTGDQTRIVQIIGNLLNNAARYTPDSGRISVALKRDDRLWCMTVKDSGIGIESHMLHRVFDLFTQAHPAVDRTHGGLGLGLALVRTLVSLHGGSVHADSDGVGTGSTFTVELPIAR